MDGDILFDVIELIFDIAVALSRNSREDSYKSSHPTRWNNNPYESNRTPVDNTLLHPELYVPPVKKTTTANSPKFIKLEDRNDSPDTPTQSIVQEETTSKSSKQIFQSEPRTSKHTIQQLIEVEIYMLIYLLQQDDGRISSDEARIIKRRLRRHNKYLRQADYQRLKQWKGQELSIDVAIQMIKDYHIPEQHLKEIFDKLEFVNKVTKRHDRILTFMKTQLFTQLNMVY